MSEQIVTGEAVVVDLRLARWPSRALALLIDIAIQIGLFALLFLVFGLLLTGSADLTGGVDDAVAATVLILIATFVLIVYPVALERLWRGKSVGKAAMGLRVVRDDGGPVRMRHSLVRALLAVFFDVWATSGGGGLIVSILNGKGKRLGDILAGTVVIQERVPARQHAVIEMHPMLASWAASLDLSGLPDELALRARSFLMRAHELSPAARESLGSALVAEVAGHVAPPPPGTPGYAYLATVVAERRRRESERLTPAPPAPPSHAPARPVAPAPPPSVPPSAPPPGPFAPPS